MKNTSATVTAVSSTMKIGKPSSSRTIGTTASAKVMARTSPSAGRLRRAPRDADDDAPERDDQDQREAERHRAVRDPHRHAGHVAGAADPQHLLGVEIGLRQHEAREHDQQQLLGDPQREAHRAAA